MGLSNKAKNVDTEPFQHDDFFNITLVNEICQVYMLDLGESCDRFSPQSWTFKIFVTK